MEAVKDTVVEVPNAMSKIIIEKTSFLSSIFSNSTYLYIGIGVVVILVIAMIIWRFSVINAQQLR